MRERSEAAADSSTLPKTAPERTLGRSEIRDRPIFGSIVYAQAWEDPAIDIEALGIGPEDDVFAICASGDNPLAFLLEGPRSLVALDLNRAQTALLKLKMAAIATLTHGELLEFVGVRPCGRREAYYARIREVLEPDAREFWDRNPDLVRRGVMHVGRFERYFRIFRWTVLPLVHSQETVARLLACRTLEEQAEFFNERWNTWRWRALFRVFFGRTVMGRLGRDPAFFKYVETSRVADQFLARARHVLVELPVRGNWFVEYILTGDYADERSLPPYLLEESHPRLRKLLDRVTVVTDEIEAYLPSVEEGRFSKFYLSDMFEYISDEAYERLLGEIVRAGRDGGRLSYRNLLVPRERPPSLSQSLVTDRDLGGRLNFRDRSFFYARQIVETIRKPGPGR